MTEFTWVPEFGISGDFAPAITVNKFGDGYQQRVAQGMNSIAGTWPLTFANRESAEATAILNFLIARGATEAFNWTPPDGAETSLVFVCPKWSVIPVKGENRKTITATFEQVFEP